MMKPLSMASWLLLIVAVSGGGTVAAKEHDADVALVLGDSVAFGYIAEAGYQYTNPDNFIGFADYLASLLRLEVVNASCPGETTSGFLSATGADYRCRPFRASFPLHAIYGSAQYEFAIKYLSRHRDVGLVTITLGANDLFLLQDSCSAHANPTLCTEAGLPALLATVAANMQTILSGVRATGYRGALVLTNYYSPDYSDVVASGLIAELNKAIRVPARAYGAVVANVFGAFQALARSRFDGHTCHTGLLNASPDDQRLCDVHPSQTGHRLIADAIARAARSRW